MDDDEFAAKEAEKFKNEKNKSLIMWIDKLDSMREILIHMDDEGTCLVWLLLSVNLMFLLNADAMAQLDGFEKELNELRE